MDSQDLKDLGHLLLLLLTVVGHLSEHHLQHREDQGEGRCGQRGSICESSRAEKLGRLRRPRAGGEDAGSLSPGTMASNLVLTQSHSYLTGRPVSESETEQKQARRTTAREEGPPNTTGTGSSGAPWLPPRTLPRVPYLAHPCPPCC